MSSCMLSVKGLCIVTSVQVEIVAHGGPSTAHCHRFYFRMNPPYTGVRDGPLEKLWREGEFSSRRNFFGHQIPCMNFFRP